MKAEELKRRRAAWSSMSELFLDNETRWEVPRISRKLLETGYDEETLNRIWHNEAVPEFSWNLLTVAGEWIQLDFDEERMVRRAAGRGPVFRFFQRKRTGVASEIWLATLALRNALSREPEERRDALVVLWAALAVFWVPDDRSWVSVREKEFEAIRHTGLSYVECKDVMESVFLPAYSGLLYGEEVSQRQFCDQRVRDLLRRAFS